MNYEQVQQLDQKYYEPSGTYEPYDPETNTFYNVFGQELRNPSEYDTSDYEWTPFGDE